MNIIYYNTKIKISKLKRNERKNMFVDLSRQITVDGQNKYINK